MAVSIGRAVAVGAYSTGSLDGILMQRRVVMTFEMAARGEPLVAGLTVVRLGPTSFRASAVVASSGRRRTGFPSGGGFHHRVAIAGAAAIHTHSTVDTTATIHAVAVHHRVGQFVGRIRIRAVFVRMKLLRRRGQ